MKSLRFLDRRAGYSLASIGLLLGMVVPAVFPAFASASGQLDARSITMSSSVASATATSYMLQFTTETAIPAGGGLVMQFCDSSSGPLIGNSTCATPTGLDITTSTGSAPTAVQVDSGSGFTNAPALGTLSHSGTTGNNLYLKWISGTGDDLAIGDKLKLTIGGIVNPSTVGTFYVRVYSYAAAPDFTNSGTLGTVADSGAVALSTTSAIGVTAYVLESMTFCVSGSGSDGLTPAPGPSCGASGQAVVTPSMTLGEVVGSQKVLDTGHVSTGVDYAQLSTNASSGAIVNLKSNATSCGGLFRNNNTANCNIAPQTTAATGITAGNALFGLTVGSSTSVSGATNPSGTLSPAGSYDGSHYYMDYAAGNATGVTSSYGSPVFSSTGAVNQKYVPITFGASIANDTPAGIYGATLNMIAVGTY